MPRSWGGGEALLLVAIVFINDANIRYSDLHTYSLDGQIVMRLFVCAACGLYGLPISCAGHNTLLISGSIERTIQRAWATFTLLFAVQKLFAIAACLALWCMVFFIPAVLMQLGGRRTTVLVAVTLTVYMVVSWFLYSHFRIWDARPTPCPIYRSFIAWWGGPCEQRRAFGLAGNRDRAGVGFCTGHTSEQAGTADRLPGDHVVRYE